MPGSVSSDSVELLKRGQLPSHSQDEVARHSLEWGQSEAFIDSRLAVARMIIGDNASLTSAERQQARATHAGLFGRWTMRIIAGEASPYKSTVMHVNEELFTIAGLAVVLKPEISKLEIPTDVTVGGVVWNPNSPTPDEVQLSLQTEQPYLWKATTAMRSLAGMIRVHQASAVPGPLL
jgi:hypothetical protein